MGLRGGAAALVVVAPRREHLLAEVGGHGVCGRHLESFELSLSDLICCFETSEYREVLFSK